MTVYESEDDEPIGLSGSEREAYSEMQDRPIAERVTEGIRTQTHVDGGIVPFPGQARGIDVLNALPGAERGPYDVMRGQGYVATAYDYQDEEGRLLMQIVHFRHASEPKEMRPLRYLGTYKDGRSKYWWKAVPGTRPLYGLDRLAAMPNAPVLMVEGEKTADAAQALFPDHVVMCWPGGAGSGAVRRVDVAPLAGRAIVAWPDNDPIGRSGMRLILARAIEAGAQSAAMVLVPGDFPPKWDLADQLPSEIGGHALLTELIAKPRVMSKSEARKQLDDPRKTSASRRVLGLWVGYSRVDKAAVETCLALVDPDSSGLWYRVLRALFYAYGTSGLALADEWSRRGTEKYKDGEPKVLFDKFAAEEGFSADTLFWVFREADKAARQAEEQDGVKPNVALDMGAYALAHIEDFNRDHAIVTRGSKTVAMWETFDPRFDRYSIEYLHKPAFQDRYVQRVPVATDKNGDPIVKPRGKHWFDDGRRRQYDRIVFLPGKTTPHGTLNAWRGFTVEPSADPSGWALLKAHLFDNVCGKDDDAFAYLMNWLAACVQRLGGPLGVALVLTGSKGAGKSILIKFLAYLFGDAAFVTARADDVLGRFNARLEHTLFLGLEEAVAVASKQQDGALKDLITREDLSLEDKFFAGWSAPSHIRMVMTSNNDHVVRADGRERRYAVFEVINAFDDDPDGRRRYFGDIVEQMETGGYEAMLGELQARDISAWNPERIPETDALRQQKLLNLANDPVAAWYYSRLEDGVNILSGDAVPSTGLHPWSEAGETWVPVSEVIRDCQHHAQQNGLRSDGQRIKAKLARFMPEGFASAVRREADLEASRPTRMFPFPRLNTARLLFQKATGFVVPGTVEEGDAGDEPNSSGS